jgi:hypothetical protein
VESFAFDGEARREPVDAFGRETVGAANGDPLAEQDRCLGPQALPNTGLNKQLLEKIALRVAAADSPEPRPQREQNARRFAVSTLAEGDQRLRRRRADLPRERLLVAGGAFT